MKKENSRLIKNYYKKPRLWKIITLRAFIIFLVLSSIILMITKTSYEEYIDYQKQFSKSPRITNTMNFLMYGYNLYILRDDKEKLKKINELYGRALNEQELYDQFLLCIRGMERLYYDDSVSNIYDEDMKDGIMDFDKPFLRFMRVNNYVSEYDSTEMDKARVYYECRDDSIVDVLNQIKDINRNDILFEMKGYYLKDMDFWPGDIYLSTYKVDVTYSDILKKIFSNGEEYYDSDLGETMKRIKLDIPVKPKEELISEGYVYMDEDISGGFFSFLSELCAIYPYDEYEKTIINNSKEYFKNELDYYSPQKDEDYESCIESEKDFFKDQYYELKYGKRVNLGEGDNKKTLNVVIGTKLNFWNCEISVDVPGLRYREFTYKNVFILGCIVALVIWVLLTILLSMFVYQRKKSIYEMNIYQRDLTNIMAHDLKSPLMVIRGSAENLQDEGENDYAKTIVDEADYMNSLISKILSLSKLESDQTNMKNESIDIKKLIDELIADYSAETERREIKTTVASAERIFPIKADSFWIKEAVNNLYDNAVKYSPDKSEITIRLGEKELSIKNKMADPDINDIERLRKRFVRGDNSRSSQSGNGLGLSIVDTILERNGLRLILKKEEDCFVAIIK